MKDSKRNQKSAKRISTLYMSQPGPNESRLITVMKIGPAPQLLLFQYSSPCSRDLIPFVLTNKREFDPLLISVLLDTAVQVTFHSAEL
jgi:hypothetical protein